MKITAKDIAKKLGISASSVSLALNDRPGVSVKTREMVLAEAARLGYSFKQQNSLSTNRNIRYVIFLKDGDIVKETSFHSIVLQGIEEKAKKMNYNVLITYFYSSEKWEEQLNAICEDVDGLIILATEMEEQDLEKAYRNGLGRHNIPIVLVDNATNAYKIDCVVADSVQGACLGTTYLLKKGHPDVGYLKSTNRIANFDQREKGVLKARREWGISEVKPLQVINVSTASERAFEDMLNWLNAGGKPVSAFFADNDIIAAACIRALKTKGYKVPEDVSIVGYDDMPICTMVSPTLTTIRVMITQLGEVAMMILNKRINNPESLTDDFSDVCRVTIPTRLIKRDSVNDYYK
ncbi:MAG: LacI family transcriptional regulator [Clostridiaceae bacterium]|nr:LacI family transcriptional regulator [Clostridiaceae bacterium]